LPTGRGQAAVDEATAARYGLRLGDVLGVAGTGALRDYRIVGTVRFADGMSVSGAGVAVLTMAQAQAVGEEPGRFGQIDIAAAPGVGPAQIEQRLATALPAEVVPRTTSQEAVQAASNLAGNIGFFRDFLLIFAYASLFVGGFIILNTFSVTVAQRTREIGLLRAMGASRSQVRRSVIGESAVLGLAGSAAGVGLGMVAAPVLDGLFRAFGTSLPDDGTVLEPRTVVVSLLTGLVISVVAALSPALRATRIPPVAALNDCAGDGEGRTARRLPVMGGCAVLAGAVMIVVGFTSAHSTALAGLGTLVVFVGVGLLTPLLMPVLSLAVGALVVRRGVTGVLARENTRRRPGRTAVTSAALMVGLALVTMVSVLAAGAKATIDTSVHKDFAGDLVVQSSSSDDLGVPASMAAALRVVPGISVVAPVDFSSAAVSGIPGVQGVTGVASEALAKLYPIAWESGSVSSLADLDGGTTVLTEAFAQLHRFQLGSTLSLLTASGRHLRLVVVGIASNSAELLGPVTVARWVLREYFAQSTDGADFVGYSPGARGTAVQRAVDRLIQRYFPQAESLTAGQFEHQQSSQVSSMLGLVYVLLGLAVMVSLFGLVNTLALAVHERRKELGLLRAVGASQAQVRQVVRYESVITALIGAVVGLAVGALFAISLAQWLVGTGFVLAIPWGTLSTLVALAALAGVLAAVLPARRAAHLDVLSALSME
jgi:putative ABC transport system permease protein